MKLSIVKNYLLQSWCNAKIIAWDLLNINYWYNTSQRAHNLFYIVHFRENFGTSFLSWRWMWTAFNEIKKKERKKKQTWHLRELFLPAMNYTFLETFYVERTICNRYTLHTRIWKIILYHGTFLFYRKEIKAVHYKAIPLLSLTQDS